MTHLSTERIVDVAEGCADAASAAHAAGCDACRAKVDALRDAWRLAEADAAPEPSPLFWPHLAARIGEAVRREPAPVPVWRSLGLAARPDWGRGRPGDSRRHRLADVDGGSRRRDRGAGPLGACGAGVDSRRSNSPMTRRGSW